jgi:hypothetical protein
MPNTPTPRAATKGEASRRFVKAVRQILSVPKEESAKREAAYQQERAAKRASRKSKLSALLLMAFCCLSVQSVSASPEERAQIFKAGILSKLMEDGWQLVQETHSLLVVERPMTGWGGPVVQALTTGAYGTKPILRWSVTVTPVNDHWSRYFYSATVNSQNAFGQTTSIAVNNRRNKAYMEAVLDAAAATLPAKYKFAPK